MIDSRPGPESGLPLTRAVRQLTISYRGRNMTIDMPGWYRDGSDESIHDRNDLRVSDRALVTLKAEIQHLLTPDQVREIRVRLGLTQTEAGRLLGGGSRAFQKYESGEVMTSRAMTNQLQLLARYPQELERLRADVQSTARDPARELA